MVKWQWIKGHQDDDVKYENLDKWAKANILVDNLAKAYWNHLSAQSYEP
jgi:ribonuclease HI